MRSRLFSRGWASSQVDLPLISALRAGGSLRAGVTEFGRRDRLSIANCCAADSVGGAIRYVIQGAMFYCRYKLINSRLTVSVINRSAQNTSHQSLQIKQTKPRYGAFEGRPGETSASKRSHKAKERRRLWKKQPVDRSGRRSMSTTCTYSSGQTCLRASKVTGSSDPPEPAMELCIR